MGSSTYMTYHKREDSNFSKNSRENYKLRTRKLPMKRQLRTILEVLSKIR
jgi:hypothetical protein